MRGVPNAGNEAWAIDGSAPDKGRVILCAGRVEVAPPVAPEMEEYLEWMVFSEDPWSQMEWSDA